MLIIVFATTARADLFNNLDRTNDEIIYNAGGYVYKMPEGGESKTLVDLGIKLKKTGGCGMFGLKASLKDLFNEDQWKSLFSNVAQSAVSSAPVLLASYASPTLVNAYMHMQNSLEKILSIRESQCQEVEKAAMRYGMLQRAKSEGKYQCILQKQHEGETIDKAINDCLSSKNNILHVLPLDSSSTGASGNLNLSHDIKNLLHMDDNDYNFFHSLVGDIKVNGNSILDNENPNAAQNVYNKEMQATENTVSHMISDAQAGTIDTGSISKIYQETGIYISPELINRLANMKKVDPDLERVYENMLDNRITLFKLKGKILKVEKEIEMAKQKATVQGNKNLVTILQEKEENLELQEKEIENRYEAAQTASQFALKIINQQNGQVISGVSKFDQNEQGVKVKNFEWGAGNPNLLFKRNGSHQASQKGDQEYGNLFNRVLGK